MTTLNRLLVVTVTLTLCACVSSGFPRNLKHKSIINRKHNTAVSKRQEETDDTGPKLFFKDRAYRRSTRIARGDTLELECEAGGSPGPTIHWLKNGRRIKQGRYHDIEDDVASYEDVVGEDGLPLLRLSTTKSKLVINCITPDFKKKPDKYTCVATTPYDTITRTTLVKVVSKAKGSYDECLDENSIASKAHVFMWTSTRVELQDNNVQLFCRAEGSPAPAITWFDNDGRPIENSPKYQLLENGDLVIHWISWFDMGVYTCTAENKYGEDVVDTFLYPTFRDDNEEEDVLPPV